MRVEMSMAMNMSCIQEDCYSVFPKLFDYLEDTEHALKACFSDHELAGYRSELDAILVWARPEYKEPTLAFYRGDGPNLAHMPGISKARLRELEKYVTLKYKTCILSLRLSYPALSVTISDDYLSEIVNSRAVEKGGRMTWATRLCNQAKQAHFHHEDVNRVFSKLIGAMVVSGESEQIPLDLVLVDQLAKMKCWCKDAGTRTLWYKYLDVFRTEYPEFVTAFYWHVFNFFRKDVNHG